MIIGEFTYKNWFVYISEPSYNKRVDFLAKELVRDEDMEYVYEKTLCILWQENFYNCVIQKRFCSRSDEVELILYDRAVYDIVKAWIEY